MRFTEALLKDLLYQVVSGEHLPEVHPGVDGSLLAEPGGEPYDEPVLVLASVAYEYLEVNLEPPNDDYTAVLFAYCSVRTLRLLELLEEQQVHSSRDHK
jgi:hypothetical protein